MADQEMIQEKIGEALGLEKAAQKAVPRFWKGQLAEKEIGLPYHEIDRILESYVRNDLKNCDISKSKIKLVTDMIRKTQHKKEHIPICNPF